MDFSKKTLAELRELAKAAGEKSVTKYKKEELISLLLKKQEIYDLLASKGISYEV